MNAPIILASSEDREAWLEDRRRGITATEVAKLASGRASERRAIMKQKMTGEFVDLSGNKFIDWGVARESVIAEWIENKFDIQPNSNAFAKFDNERHIATPDGISYTFEDDLTIAEIKTTMKDLTPGTVEFEQSGYLDQMMWQMHVMGATRTLFVFERHNNVWQPTPTPFEPEFFWIERDQKRIDQLIEIADKFLADLNSNNETILPDDDELGSLMNRLLVLREAEAEAKQNKEIVWKRIQELVADREDFSDSTELANISWNTTVKEIDVVDLKLFKEKESDIVSKYESKLAEYTVKEIQEKHTLTITPKK